MSTACILAQVQAAARELLEAMRRTGAIPADLADFLSPQVAAGSAESRSASAPSASRAAADRATQGSGQRGPWPAQTAASDATSLAAAAPPRQRQLLRVLEAERLAVDRRAAVREGGDARGGLGAFAEAESGRGGGLAALEEGEGGRHRALMRELGELQGARQALDAKGRGMLEGSLEWQVARAKLTRIDKAIKATRAAIARLVLSRNASAHTGDLNGDGGAGSAGGQPLSVSRQPQAASDALARAGGRSDGRLDGEGEVAATRHASACRTGGPGETGPGQGLAGAASGGGQLGVVARRLRRSEPLPCDLRRRGPGDDGMSCRLIPKPSPSTLNPQPSTLKAGPCLMVCRAG